MERIKLLMCIFLFCFSEKLPSHMKLNVNLAGLLPPGGAITKKTIDSLRRDGGAQEKEKTPDEKEILLPTPSESTDVSPQSDLTSPESSSSFLPSLTKVCTFFIKI